MALRLWPAAAILWGAMTPGLAHAQTTTAEVDVTAGRSTDGAAAAAMQARLFGDRAGWRYYAEAEWGLVSGGTTGAFGAAYPYDRRIRPMETYAERMMRPGGGLFAVRAGQYRTPFGISGRSDHAYSGFLRAPLVRYAGNFALSNTYLEAGVDVLAGSSSHYVEASVGVPQDLGADRRRAGLDVVVRAQAYVGDLIVGISTLRTQPTAPATYAFGRMVFHGVDARWMAGGVQLRGEWITGRPFDGVTTRGGYLDVLVHRLGMGPITAVARVERLDYEAGPFSTYPRRFTTGGRVRVTSSISGQINVLWQSGYPAAPHTALDAAVTYSRRF